MAILTIRIEDKTKAAAAKTFEKMGLDMSSAVKLFLTQSIKEDGLPFTPTNDSKAIRARWDAEAVEALKNGKRYDSAEQMISDILSTK